MLLVTGMIASDKGAIEYDDVFLMTFVGVLLGSRCSTTRSSHTDNVLLLKSTNAWV